MTITKRGRELAAHLNPYIGTTIQIQETCSRLARLMATHNRLAEVECDVDMTPKQRERFDNRVEQIEEAIKRHVATLPHTDDGPITVKLGGDPRGFTVKLKVPNKPADGNTWGRDGEFGL